MNWLSNNNIQILKRYGLPTLNGPQYFKQSRNGQNTTHGSSLLKNNIHIAYTHTRLPANGDLKIF